jgi:hypothetical protein
MRLTNQDIITLAIWVLGGGGGGAYLRAQLKSIDQRLKKIEEQFVLKPRA